ncbi:MAG: sulfotransferase domain-containing protein [Mariprofundaceae bacterium]|nr:sulfotransferase domain-containing protein [Mariprofundaceae bacterium]
MQTSHPILICGLHRSGTTYMGEILAQSNRDISVIHELFNFGNGLKQVDCWYPYLTSGMKASPYIQTIEDALLAKGALKKPSLNKVWYKYLFHRISGGRMQFPWRYLKLRHQLHLSPQHVIWKDPFCTLMLDYITRYKGCPTICMVKHPCALYSSIAKQNWHFDIQHLGRQTSLINDFGSGITRSVWQEAQTSNHLSIAILWKIMSRIVIHIQSLSDSLLLVRHEDLCYQPLQVIEAVSAHVNIPINDKMRQFLLQSTQGNRIEVEAGVTRSFHRDSRSLPQAWENQLSAEQVSEILDVVGEDIHAFY